MILGTQLNAQFYGQYTQHMLNKYQFNPAFAGLERSLSVHLSTRSQWTNLTENPGQQYISAHMPVYMLNGGIGFQVENESLGLQRSTSATLSYNYILQNSLGIFSFGGGVGFMSLGLEGGGIITPDGVYTDTETNHNDPQLNESFINSGSIISNIGVYYAGNLFEGGISLLNFPSRASGLDPSNISLDPRLSIYLESYFFLGNPTSKITTSIMLMTNGSATQITTGALGEFGNILAGLSIRGFSSNSIDGLNFILGSKVNPKLRVSYSYDYGLNSLQNFSEGSHELQINYNLNKQISWGLPPEVIYNTRSL
jgi:type IX secretion system PorP/SprF family membrane protein